MKIFGITVLVLGGMVGLIVVSAAMGLITIPWLKFTSQIQTNRDIVAKTYNAENALYNYRWFKDRHESIKATEIQIENAMTAQENFRLSAGVRSTWTFEDKTEDARLGSVVLGLKNHYQEIVAEYNSRAKQVDRNIFIDDLPLFFSLKPY
jgi:hypothetical protein